MLACQLLSGEGIFGERFKADRTDVKTVGGYARGDLRQRALECIARLTKPGEGRTTAKKPLRRPYGRELVPGRARPQENSRAAKKVVDTFLRRSCLFSQPNAGVAQGMTTSRSVRRAPPVSSPAEGFVSIAPLTPTSNCRNCDARKGYDDHTVLRRNPVGRGFDREVEAARCE